MILLPWPRIRNEAETAQQGVENRIVPPCRNGREARWAGDVKQVDGGDCCQQYITFAADPVTAPDELEVFYRRLAHRLKTENGRVVWGKAFGSLDSREWVERCRQRYLPQKHSNHPFTYLEGAPVGGKGLAGLVLYILRGKEVGYLPRKGCVEYRVDQNRRIYLAPGAAGENRGPSGLAQDFSQSVGRIQKALEQAGMRCSDAVRTWFYLGNIQRDYSLFNTLRREMFDDAGIEYSASSNDLPASTCIEGASPDSTCTMEFLCCDKKTVKLRRIYNPEQNEAEGDQYLHRPTFSRGMLLRTDHFCELQISGTASIDARGKERVFVGSCPPDGKDAPKCTKPFACRRYGFFGYRRVDLFLSAPGSRSIF